MVGHPRPWVVTASAVSLIVVAATGLVLWRVVGPGDTYTAAPPRPDDREPDTVAAAQALSRLVSAVSGRDPAAAAALAPQGDAAAATLLGAVVENARALDVVGFTARYVDASGGLDADGGWPAAVDLAWRFEGFDAHPVHEQVRVSFRQGRGAVGIIGFGGGTDRSPLWLSGPLDVRRTSRSLVLATTADDAAALSRRADRAVRVVRRVLPHWPGRLVVEVPASEPALDRVLGADPDSYTEIAAVTAPVDGTVTADSPIHVFVNPTLYDTLDPVGGQVVLSHEATHVATDAPVTAGLPPWLLEGFADYVALRDVRLPLSTTAGQILGQVRRSGPPDHLPDSTDFDPHATHLGAAYEAAWLVCRTLADAGGEPALVRLYQRVSAGRPLAAELRRLFGLTEDQLLARWQDRLTALADGGAAAA